MLEVGVTCGVNVGGICLALGVEGGKGRREGMVLEIRGEVGGGRSQRDRAVG